MCMLTLVLCVGVASSARIYRSDRDDHYSEGVYSNVELPPSYPGPPQSLQAPFDRPLGDRSVRDSYNHGGGGHFQEGRQNRDRGPGPSDGPVDLGPSRVKPYGGRYGEPGATGPGRPGGPPPPPPTDRRGFGDRSNEITDENIDRIRSTIYANVPTDRQPLYASTFKYDQNNFNNRHAENTEHRGAGADPGANRRGAGDGRRHPELDVNRSQGGDGSRGTSDNTAPNTQREPDTAAHSSRGTHHDPAAHSSRGTHHDTAAHSSRGTHHEAATKNARPEKPVAGRNATDGHGVVEESTWVWSPSADTSTAAATTVQDLDNRASFSGDNCPTGQVKVDGKCVETH